MPALLELAPILALVALCLFCYLALQGYKYSLSPLLRGFADLIHNALAATHIPGAGGVGAYFARKIGDLDHLVIHWLGAGISTGEDALAGLWNGTAALTDWIARELEDLANDTAHGFQRVKNERGGLNRKTVGRLIGAATGALGALLGKRISIVTHGLSHRIEALVRRAVALEHELTAVRGFTAKQLRAALRRLAKLGWLAGVASIAGLGALIFKHAHLGWLTKYRTLAAFGLALLAKLGLGWLRCDSVGRAGKGVCGMDTDLLDSLLLDTLLIVGTVSLSDWIRELQAIEGITLEAIDGFIRP